MQSTIWEYIIPPVGTVDNDISYIFCSFTMAATTSFQFADKQDFENSRRGFIATLDPCIIRLQSTGRIIWNNEDYRFLQGTDCPTTVNPSLWRQAQLVVKHGLFEVTPGIYQVRGFDISNMTIIEGSRGAIVVDPLISTECAAAAWTLYQTHRGTKPITGLIYTHPHLDHYGGARGVIPDEDSKVPILAPEGFLEHAVSENVYAGTPMSRRAVYMYGESLPKGPEGQVSCGLGATNSTGTVSLLPPTLSIMNTGQEEVIDGVRFIFQLTPDTEAPSEMNFFLPQHRTLCMAENACHTLHNILTLRGAAVRDAASWSRYLDESIELFSPDTDIVFSSHHWPTWGQSAIIQFLSEQRDLYGYLHDQTVRMINQGLTGAEIAEEFILPERLQRTWHARGYYGSVSHNVKAIYERYMGWYDGNPVHLWEHPPVQQAERYVECLGGIDSTIEKAKTFAQKGDLRFAATLLGHAVFAAPGNSSVRDTLASVFEQLGYGAENATWRNFYLTGAHELRNGISAKMVNLLNPEMLLGLTVEQLLSSLAVRLDGPRAQYESFAIDLHVQDIKRSFRLVLSNGVLIHRGREFRRSSEGTQEQPVGFSCSLTKAQLTGLLLGKGRVENYENTGDPRLFETLISYATDPDPCFAIVMP